MSWAGPQPATHYYGRLSASGAGRFGRAEWRIRLLHKTVRDHVTNDHVAIFDSAHVRFGNMYLNGGEGAQTASIAAGKRDRGAGAVRGSWGDYKAKTRVFEESRRGN